MSDFPAEDFPLDRVKANPTLMAHPDVVELVEEAERWQAAYLEALAALSSARADHSHYGRQPPEVTP